MSNKKDVLDFLYQSISDAQETIRALDIKAGFLFVILFAPLPIANDIYPDAIVDFRASIAGGIVVAAALASWVLAIVFQFMALAATINPSDRITGPSAAKGSLFSGDLFSFGFIEAFFGSKVKSSQSVTQQISRLPSTEEEIIEELTLERMKLAYILAMKAARSKYSTRFTMTWLACSFILALFDAGK